MLPRAGFSWLSSSGRAVRCWSRGLAQLSAPTAAGGRDKGLGCGEGRLLLPADPSADCRAELRAVVGGPEEAAVTSQQEGK